MLSSQLQASVEAVLFMNHKPISLLKLQELVSPEIDLEEFRAAVSNLQSKYMGEENGIELVEVANGFQLRTKIEHKELIQRMFQIAPMKLTSAMLEVLSITAYNQPVTREVIDKIRGVDSSHLVRVLLDKKLLRIAGKSDELGKPMLYATSKEFLELFGLRDLSALPSLREIEEMLPTNEVGSAEEEEAALGREMEIVVAETKPVAFNDLEDWEEENASANEIQSGGAKAGLSTEANADSSQTSLSAGEGGGEAGRALDQPEETFGDLPLGPTGHA